MQTLPMALDATRGEPSDLGEYRLDKPADIAAVLRQLCDAGVTLQVMAGGDAADAGGGGSDAAVAATLWSSDAERGSLSLAVDTDDPVVATALAGLLEGQDAHIVGYLDQVKVQFEVGGLVLIQGPRSSTLKCDYPAEIYRLQRRGAFRIRPAGRSNPPTASVRHSEIAEMRLSLRLINVSIGGCALFLPDDVPPMRPGQVLNRVQLDLDADTRVSVDLRLQHVTSLNSDSRGVRLGCEFLVVDGTALRALQRFIDRSQQRGRLLSSG